MIAVVYLLYCSTIKRFSFSSDCRNSSVALISVTVLWPDFCLFLAEIFGQTSWRYKCLVPFQFTHRLFFITPISVMMLTFCLAHQRDILWLESSQCLLAQTFCAGMCKINLHQDSCCRINFKQPLRETLKITNSLHFSSLMRSLVAVTICSVIRQGTGSSSRWLVLKSIL